jgi:hypothetical protein
LNLLESVLDLDPDTVDRCQGNPVECGTTCTDEGCPLRNNQVTRLGSLVLTLLEEFRWYRAWAEELESLHTVPEGTVQRVALRVRQSITEDTLHKAETSLKTVPPSMQEEVRARIQTLHDEIQDIERRLKENPHAETLDDQGGGN